MTRELEKLSARQIEWITSLGFNDGIPYIDDATRYLRTRNTFLSANAIKFENSYLFSFRISYFNLVHESEFEYVSHEEAISEGIDFIMKHVPIMNLPTTIVAGGIMQGDMPNQLGLDKFINWYHDFGRSSVELLMLKGNWFRITFKIPDLPAKLLFLRDFNEFSWKEKWLFEGILKSKFEIRIECEETEAIFNYENPITKAICIVRALEFIRNEIN